MWNKIKEVNPATIFIISDHPSLFFFFDEKRILKQLNATIIDTLNSQNNYVNVSINNQYEKPLLFIVSDPFCINSTPSLINQCNAYKKAYKDFYNQIR